MGAASSERPALTAVSVAGDGRQTIHSVSTTSTTANAPRTRRSIACHNCPPKGRQWQGICREADYPGGDPSAGVCLVVIVDGPFGTNGSVQRPVFQPEGAFPREDPSARDGSVRWW